LSRPPFGRLFGSYTVNELGDSVGIVALALLVYEGSGEAAATAAFFVAAKFIPAFIAPALTARLDQLELGRTLGNLYVIEAFLFAVLAYVAAGHYTLGVVLVLAVLDGTLAVTARGLTRGAVGTLMQPVGLLKEANGLLNMGFAAASVGGAALAGLLVSQFSFSTALAVDAASFAVIAMVMRGTTGLPAALPEQQGWRVRFRNGLAFARTSSTVRLLLLGEAVALVFFTLVIPIEVIYARESLDTTSAGFGLLLAAWGAGIVLGSLFYVLVRSRQPLALILGSTAAVGFAYGGMAIADTLLVACLFSILGGAGNGVQWISVVTGLQEATPLDMQARVVGLLESLAAAMPGVGFLLGAIITTIASPRTAYAVAGIGVLVLVALACVVVAWSSRRGTPWPRGEDAEPPPQLDVAVAGTSSRLPDPTPTLQAPPSGSLD
jgi:MFS family permease